VPAASGEGGEGAAMQSSDGWFYGQRAYPQTFTPPHALQRELAQAHALRNAAAAEGATTDAPLTWTSIGPRPIGSSPLPEGTSKDGQFPTTGRVTAIATDPTNHRIAYAGGAYGGVWKTTDDGANWSPVSDGLPSLAVGALAIDPANGNTLYLGTGEANNPGYVDSFNYGDSYYGAGLFKSTDGGNHWTKVGGAGFDGCHVGDLAVTGNVVLAAVSQWNGIADPACTRRGMWRSTDGGGTWSLATTTYTAGEPKLETPDDIAVDPAHGGTLYAGYRENGIFKSTDYGASWAQLANAPRHADGVGRTSVAVSNDGTHVYALVSGNGGAGQLLGVYRSTDAGVSWSAVGGTTSNLCAFDDAPANAVCQQANVIAVKPTDPTTFFAAGTTMNKFTSEGDVAAEVSYPDKIHADFRAVAYDAFNRLWIGTDGGVYRTQNDGATYANLNQTLALTQFYPGISGTLGGRLLGGTQDNGTLSYDGAGSWAMVNYSDGGPSAVDPTDPAHVFYSSMIFGLLFRTTDGGTTFTEISDNVPVGGDAVLFLSPFLMSPTDHNTLYLGEQRVWRSADRGDHWTPLNSRFPDVGSSHQLASAIGAAGNSNVLYVGTTTGGLWVTQNGGASWVDTLGNGLPGRYVTDVEVRPDHPATAYVTVSGFGSTTPSNTGHVFKTIDYGAHWTNISATLPDGPANAILADYRTTPATLYVGTDVGVFWSLDDGAFWANTSTGLPATAVMDLRLDAATNTLLAATHGRGMLTTPALTTTHMLTVTKNGTGGRVTSAPAGMDCGSTCTHAFFEGAQVVLSASPDYGWSFGGWSGACTNATGTCAIAMDADKAVTATFTKRKYRLTVAMNGDGSGMVSSGPAGISCGPLCGFEFDYQTAVTLTPSPAANSTFGRWSGACSGTGGCTVTMDAAKSVLATFDLSPPACVVPNVKGKALGRAKRAISRRHCKVGRIKRAYSTHVKTGLVISQSPAAGRHLKNGAKIKLTLSRGRARRSH
jgi:PASTA domain/Divergent InlB B-repeat domain